MALNYYRVFKYSLRWTTHDSNRKEAKMEKQYGKTKYTPGVFNL